MSSGGPRKNAGGIKPTLPEGVKRVRKTVMFAPDVWGFLKGRQKQGYSLTSSIEAALRSFYQIIKSDH